MLSKDQVLVEIRKLMDELGCVGYMPNIKEITKKSKSLEKDMYYHFGGVNAVADELGIMPYAKYKAAEKMKAEKAKAKLSEIKPAKIEPIEDVSEERFEEAYAAAHQEPEVITMVDEPIIYTEEQTYEPEKAVQDQKVFDAYAHKVAQYEKLSVDILDCMKIENDLRKRQEELNIWLEGFEAAAKLAGVSLE